MKISPHENLHWRWRQHGRLKIWYHTTVLHGITYQKISTWIFTTVKTWNPQLNSWVQVVEQIKVTYTRRFRSWSVPHFFDLDGHWFLDGWSHAFDLSQGRSCLGISSVNFNSPMKSVRRVHSRRKYPSFRHLAVAPFLRSTVRVYWLHGEGSSFKSWHSDFQQVPSFFWNSKVHYRVHKSPLFYSVKNQLNATQPLDSFVSEVCSDYSPEIFLPKFYSFFTLRATWHPSHPPLLEHANNIWWCAEVMKPSLCSLLQPPETSSLFVPNILLSTLFSDTLNLCLFLSMEDQVSHPY
jgi:hypothetical protein